MKAQIAVFICFCLWILYSPVHASDDAATFWPVEQRCIPNPVLPPNGWSYPGMILMSGQSGIHAIQSTWETPHVVAFFRENKDGDRPVEGGQLSPDAHWYAAPIGNTFTEVSFNTYWSIESLRLYSTSDDSKTIDFNLSDYQDIYTYYEVAWSYLPVEWLDNNSLIIGKLLIHPFENTVEEAPFSLEGTTLENRFISPDVTLAYFSGNLYQLADPEPTIANIRGIDSISWSPDSAEFIADKDNKLILYNRKGEIEASIFDLGEGEVNLQMAGGRNEILWSPDGNQFAFTGNFYPEPNHIYLVDRQAKKVIDTCLAAIDNPIWSPDGTMLAYIALSRDSFKIIIVDLHEWKAYDVARHSGYLMGWRSIN